MGIPEMQTAAALSNHDLRDEIKAYWSRLVFSGGARPPVSPDSHAEQVRILASTPGAVSYVERSTVDSRVKIVFDFAQPTP